MANGQPWLNNGAVEVLSRLAEHPLWKKRAEWKASGTNGRRRGTGLALGGWLGGLRSEEHTSELQSQSNLVCRLLLEKKKGTLESRGGPRIGGKRGDGPLATFGPRLEVGGELGPPRRGPGLRNRKPPPASRR